MYTFYPVDNSKSNIDVVVIRAIFAIAAAGAFTRYAEYGWIAVLATVLLAAVALYVNAIIRFAKMPVLLLMVISIALLCVVTWSPYFALVLVLHWLLNKFFSKEPKYEIDANSIRVTSLFAQKTYTWVEVQNVVLKDGLLTIDFLNNHILQYPVIAKEKELNEKAFNQFCTLQLQTLNLKP